MCELFVGRWENDIILTEGAATVDDTSRLFPGNYSFSA